MKGSRTVNITNDILMKTLDGMVIHNNKDAITKLIHDMLATSSQGADYFIRFALGEEYPVVPNINDTGLVLITNLVWSAEDKEMLRKSCFNQNDHIEVVVKSFNGLHDYSQLTVEYPMYDANGKLCTDRASIKVEYFTPSEFDPETWLEKYPVEVKID